MFYKTLDFLACPKDKIPLKNISVEGVEEIPFSEGRSIFKCSRYCAFLGKDIADGKEYPCNECACKWIRQGGIVCDGCGSLFKIEDGIPGLILCQDEPEKSETDERNETALEYDGKFPPGRDMVENETILRRLRLMDEDSVLELGSGTGRQTISILQRCREIVCLDFSMESLKVLVRKYKENPDGWLHPIMADINHIPVRIEHKFKKILSSGTIHHVPKSKKDALLQEIDSYLDDAGIFVVTAYNHSQKTEETKVKEGFHSGRIYFYRYDSEEFRKYLDAVFQVSDISGILNLPTYKFTGLLMRAGFGKVALTCERIIEMTSISYFSGELLAAVCRKK